MAMTKTTPPAMKRIGTIMKSKTPNKGYRSGRGDLKLKMTNVPMSTKIMAAALVNLSLNRRRIYLKNFNLPPPRYPG
jgi:hypothetical protein